MNNNILLIHCKDESGLIYKITGVVYKYRLNIVSNAEFVERSKERFFMRTEFAGDFDKSAMLSDLKAILPADAETTLTDNSKKNIVILATKEYHCLSDLLIRHKFNDLNANIIAVISNYPNLAGLTEKFGVPFYCIDHSGKTREEHEAEMLLLLKQLNPTFIVLAKYMRILSADFTRHFTNQIINIHHSFLPAFIGANPYQKAYDRGVKIIGATAHFVNEDLDEGPIIAQNVIPVTHSHSAKEMAQAGRDVEKNVLATSLNLVLNERVFVYGNKTIIFE